MKNFDIDIKSWHYQFITNHRTGYRGVYEWNRRRTLGTDICSYSASFLWILILTFVVVVVGAFLALPWVEASLWLITGYFPEVSRTSVWHVYYVVIMLTGILELIFLIPFAVVWVLERFDHGLPLLPYPLHVLWNKAKLRLCVPVNYR